MIDSDMIIPEDALGQMLAEPKEVCLGIYPRKNTKVEKTECFKLDQRNFLEVYTYSDLDSCGSTYVEIKGGGLGCALIKTEVFTDLNFPYFKYVIYNNGDVLSEDNYFCHQVTSAGYKIYMNTNVRCGHSVRGFQWR